jgi:hypothetical protein
MGLSLVSIPFFVIGSLYFHDMNNKDVIEWGLFTCFVCGCVAEVVDML